MESAQHSHTDLVESGELACKAQTWTPACAAHALTPGSALLLASARAPSSEGKRQSATVLSSEPDTTSLCPAAGGTGAPLVQSP